MFESKLNKGVANGYAPLDGNGKVNLQYIANASVITTSGTTIYSVSPATSGFSGVYSIFIGELAGAYTVANNANFFGYQAGVFATNANGSNFLGSQAGSGATNASNSNFLGTNAGQGATSATQSNFLGGAAGFDATGASFSNFFSNSAGINATDAQYSNFFGQNAGANATNASYSNFLGNQAGNSASAATGSNFLGNSAGSGATNANSSNFLGNSAGAGAIRAFDSNFFGSYAGFGAIDANSSTFMGNSAGYQTVNGSASVFIGVNAGANISGAPANFYYASNFIGPNAGNAAHFAYNSNFFGDSAGYQATAASSSNFFGYRAGYLAVSASNSTFIGQSAGDNATYADNSVFIGWNAGIGATGVTGANFIGQDAGNMAMDAEFSNFIGINAGSNAPDAANSNFIGLSAGLSATSAFDSNFLGNGAGFQATNASESNFIGYHAGYGAPNASFSNFLGFQAGFNAFTGDGVSTNNIIIGTNITLPDDTINSLNIGGVLFGTGLRSEINDYPSITAETGAKIGIGVVSSAITNTLHVSGTNPLRLQGLASTTADTSILSVDTNGVVHSFPVSSISGGSGNINGLPFNIVGNYLNDNFQRASLGTGYTATTPNVSLTFPSSNRLHVTGGTNSFANFAKYTNGGVNFTTDNYQVTLNISPLTNAAADGIGFGFLSVINNNPASYYVKIDLGTANVAGIKVYSGQTLGTPLASSTGITFKTGDTLQAIVTRKGPVFTYILTNLNNSLSVSTSYTYDRTQAFNYEPNLGTPVLYFFQGTQDVTLFQIVDQTQKSGNAIGLGDSIMEGYKSTNVGSEWISVLFSGNTNLYNVQAGVSEQVSDALGRVSRIISASTKYCLINLGVNDIFVGVSNAVYSANVDSIVVSLKNAGITPILISVTPLTAFNVSTGYNPTLSAISVNRSVKYVDVFTPLATGTALNPIYDSGDNIHPNNAGHGIIATTIRNACPELFTGYTQNNLQASRLPAAITTPYIIGSDEGFNLFRVPTITAATAVGNVGDLQININGTLGTPSGDKLYFDTLNTRLGVGSAGAALLGTIHIQDIGGANTGLYIKSTGIASNSYTQFSLVNNNTDIGQIFLTNSTYTPSGVFLASQYNILNTGAGGININSSNASGLIKFIVGGSATVAAASITASGKFLIGTSSDDGVNQVQISAATNPLRLIGLSATTADTSVLTVDATGAVHKTTTTNIFPHGQVVLSAGTKTVVINGITSSSLGFPSVLVVSGATGATPTFDYIASASTNSLLIRAVTLSGTTNTGDSSTVNYFVLV